MIYKGTRGSSQLKYRAASAFLYWGQPPSGAALRAWAALPYLEIRVARDHCVADYGLGAPYKPLGEPY